MSGRKRPNASSPASAVSFTARAISIRFSGPDVSAAMSHLLDFRPPEDALGQEDQRNGEDREGGDVLVVDREVGGPHGLDQPDQQAAEHRARQRADAAE